MLAQTVTLFIILSSLIYIYNTRLNYPQKQNKNNKKSLGLGLEGVTSPWMVMCVCVSVQGAFPGWTYPESDTEQQDLQGRCL